MKKRILLGALLLVITNFTTQAQSTASGSSNTGTPTSGATPAQNGSTGPTVSNTKDGSSQSVPKSNGRKMKRTSKPSKSGFRTSTGQ